MLDLDWARKKPILECSLPPFRLQTCLLGGNSGGDGVNYRGLDISELQPFPDWCKRITSITA